ncbi:hypothetical protein F8M41_014456 [Gigaspora margarita]|uniref:Uncharacterized protein n=1 Tax=Gigaspora margarita TaxID=4874 RepID=A0A8H4ARJ5_GIGMA|nr:hypothetical protein F8M41_014456 [Gigaspora margarita]
MKVAHENRIQQLLKRQNSDLSFYKLALSSQEQEEMSSPSVSQDLIEETEKIEEVPDTPASDENEYIFKPRVRNPVLNRFISFNIDYKNTAVEELDDNFSETSTESNKISDNNDNAFKDYSALDFEIP